MYNWKNALSEFYIFLLVIFFVGVCFSFLSAWIEQLIKSQGLSYLKIVGINVSVSLVGTLILTVFWISTGLMSENVRIVVSPVMAFLAMWLVKYIFLSKLTGFNTLAKIGIALIHPVVFCILPVIGIVYAAALGKAFKN